MKVELKIGKWGWRYVHVDGRAEPWAEIHWDSHGPRGRTWYWRDPIRHIPLMVPNGEANKPRRAEIRTGHSAGFEIGDPGAHRPTNERLLKVSEYLIAAGHIVNPAVTREALRAKDEARKRKAAQARERERKSLEKRAEACIELLEHPLENGVGGLPLSKHWQHKIVANIVAAMKWAQTR